MSRLAPAAALVAAALAGCLDLDQEFTVNPDGSGKVVLRMVYAPMDVIERNEGQKPDDLLRESVKQFLEGSNGVEAWKAVTYEVRKDGKFSLQGTAYFKDLSTVRIFGRGVRISFLDQFTLSKDDRGNLVLEAASEEGAFPGRKAPATDLSEEQLQTRVKMEQAKFEQMRPMMEGLFKDMHMKTRLNLPVAVDSASLFRKAGDDAVELELKGQELIKVMDGLMKDEAFVRKQIKEGADLMGRGPSGNEFLYEKLFGQKGPARVTLKGAGRPRFDFAAEVAAARKEDAGIRKKLGLVRESAEAPAFRERNPQALLREHLSLDLLGTEALLAPSMNDDAFRQHLMRCLSEGSYRYDLRSPRSSSSASSSQDSSFVKLVQGEKGMAEAEFHQGGDGGTRLSVSQDDRRGDLTLLMIDSPRETYVFLVRKKDGKTRLMGMRGDRTLASSWESLEEAFRREPVALEEMILSPLKAFPLTVRPTPADPQVADLCLRWHEAADGETVRRVKGCRERMASDDIKTRDDASAELAKIVAQDAKAFRLVLAMAGEEQDSEIKGRFRAAADSRKDLAQAADYVSSRDLHRDLAYLGALLESGDPARAAAARSRLAALTGREFAKRADFDAWHKENAKRLTWDAASGRYRARD